jgi:hypothetical protein
VGQTLLCSNTVFDVLYKKLFAGDTNRMARGMTRQGRSISVLILALLGTIGFAGGAFAQAAQRATAVELGSRTAKGGFKNETEIAGKFNGWRTDDDARRWLAAMNYRLDEVESVVATKPHGEKADVEVRIKTRARERREGISIKLVSSPNGFNQIDKRWLAAYARMWNMPPGVIRSLKLFTGETPPAGGSRNPKRMFLNEFDVAARNEIVDFFTQNKAKILHALFSGDGPHAAGWFMVALKGGENTRWILKTDADAVRFFGEGKVEITRSGNLKIGRVTMQRKGGDGGRETAKMLQFKINPAALFLYSVELTPRRELKLTRLRRPGKLRNAAPPPPVQGLAPSSRNDSLLRESRKRSRIAARVQRPSPL